jgi:peptidoglycan LD-endopeptidase LytH
VKLSPWSLLLVVGGAVYLVGRSMKTYLLPPITPARMRNDRAGLGHFGAPRGGRLHKGLDIIAAPGAVVRAPVDGVVTKVGFAYPGTWAFTYVEILHGGGDRVRVFYCGALPGLVGRSVRRGDVIGAAQNIAAHHGGGMVNHVHLELWRGGVRVDPAAFLELVS